MIVEKYSKYRDKVDHLLITFSKPEKAEYVGEWSTEWREMFLELHSELQAMIRAGYGILDVKITKTEPASGIVFTAEITYWQHP